MVTSWWTTEKEKKEKTQNKNWWGARVARAKGSYIKLYSPRCIKPFSRPRDKNGGAIEMIEHLFYTVMLTELYN